MKKPLVLASVILSFALVASSCGSGGASDGTDTTVAATTTVADDTTGVTPIPGSELSDALTGIQTATSLTVEESEALLWMREEEKLAHDVYVTLGEQWSVRVFDNIASAELTHTDAVKALLDRYHLDDPVPDATVGVFRTKAFTDLYGSFVSEGSTSQLQAMVAGAKVEELDIKDHQDRATSTPDIKLVFDNLEKGSRNHLRAFVRQIERLGGVYTPAYLDQSAYDSIIAGSMEPGIQG